MYFASEKEGNCTQVLQKIVRVCVGKKEGEKEEGGEWVRYCDLGRLVEGLNKHGIGNQRSVRRVLISGHPAQETPRRGMVWSATPHRGSASGGSRGCA